MAVSRLVKIACVGQVGRARRHEGREDGPVQHCGPVRVREERVVAQVAVLRSVAVAVGIPSGGRGLGVAFGLLGRAEQRQILAIIAD